jgi:TolB-like protein
MKRFARVALALTSAALVVPTFVAAQAAKPIVAVLSFENNSIGPTRGEYDGVGKGIAELMINDLLGNQNIRVVERERVQALITEQNLVKSGAIDPQTAIRLGRMLGAQYMITGGFIADKNGNVVLTGRTINVETSAIGNPTRINAKGDDVLGMIAQLTEKMNTEMKLPPLRTADAGPSATPAGAPASAVASTPAASTPAATTPAASAPATKVADSKPAATKGAPKARKMDMKTAMLYSKALEAEDAGNRSQAAELYRKVDQAFPDYAPVKKKLAKLS